ncbi:putative membrane protein [Rhizomicrobium palustre]|uniref:Putative membrane protein n=1 Tax=Rhizomicrobium palustre TaxID=189966 RepID=A0A846MVP0_9PROT|nr:TPM domain-containing protein [Rhizomicrobium palustre]NIK87285.1 putative membrane protein [Rhizomicrobium palustre]
MQKLSDDQRKALRAAQDEAAKRTSARIAVLTVPVSDHYKLYPLIYTGVTAMLVFTVLAALVPHMHLREAFLFTAAAAAVVALASEFLPLRLALIPRHAKNWEAWELAHRAFASRILAQNERKTGILFFVSFGEHYVEVVTDRDVDLHIPQGTWDAIIKEFLAEAKAGRAGEALPKAITACAKVLEPYYPPA